MASCEELPPGIDKLLEHQLQQLDFAFVISDATAADTPICFASSKFYEMTGYNPSEVVGKNCRFLQGKDTEKRKVMEIRDAIREDRCCQVCLTNYRKDGSAFLNQFFLSPIRDPVTGNVSHYVGIQTDVTALKDLEVPQHLHEQQAAGAPAASSSCCMPSSLLQPLMRIQQSFVLADPRLPDCPIIHASQHFLQLTGYSRSAASVTVTLLNYTKTGQPFYNALHVAPVRDAEGQLEYLIGIQLDITQHDLPATKSSSEPPPRLQLNHRMAHLGVTGAVRVACRGLSGDAGGLRRSIDHQGLPHRGYAHRLSSDGGSSSKHGDGVIAGEYDSSGLVGAS
eukprot:gene6688-6911_t